MGFVFGNDEDPQTSSGAVSTVHRNKFKHLKYGIARLLVNWTNDHEGWTLRHEIEIVPGSIHFFPFDIMPTGYASVLPQIRNIAELPRVFPKYGTKWGGNGTSTFGVAPLPGRVIGVAGAGSGLTNRNVGDQVGTETVALSGEHNGPHAHNFGISLSNVTSPAGIIGLLSSNANLGVTTVGVSTQGSGTPHQNMQPTIFLLVGIKT